MLVRSRLCLALIVLSGLSTTARAEELDPDFLRGLRDRQYFDMAIYYLDQLALRSDLATEIRQVIPYQKAITFLEWSKATRSPEKQTEQLDQALAFLEQFVKESPNHPSAADANTERAQILIGKARVEIAQSRSPNNQGAKADYQKRARELIAKARDVFQTAFTQHEAAWKAFGTYIDKVKDPDKFEAREKSETNMIRAQLDLALCNYEEAQTYDADTPQNKKILNDAAAKFEEMHQRYRSQVAGLYARLYQAKCFEEQGDLQKALGIYNELSSHPGEEGPLSRLKDQTLQFKLICLNTKERSDHQLVADLANEWLKSHGPESRTRLGLGIRWEMARAYEALGDRREMSKADAQRNWREARDQAMQINKFPSEYRDVSLAMIQRLDVKLGGRERLPDKFDTAFGIGRQMVTAIQEQKKALDAARAANKPRDEVNKLELDLNAQVREATEMFERAMQLVTRQDDLKSVTQAQYMYAYVQLLSRKNYEAAILGEYVARTADQEESTYGLDGAYLSMAAYVQAFNDNKESADLKAADLQFIINAANLLTERWPESDRANDARMTLGGIYTQLKKPAQAAEWFGRVPEADPKFPAARLAAGQAYWTAFLSASRMPEDERPTADQVKAWQAQSDQYLREGISKLAATLSTEGAAPGELIAAKMSLAQIIISQGQDAEAIKLLLDDPHSVIKAITVPDESKRPAKGVQSRQFATETYKLLLRAYIGGGKLNEARETMKTLETVAGGEAGGDITDLYVGLGKLLREELDRLRQAGEKDRFNQLMTSFETFLNDLYARKEGQSFGSLSWIGETYFALGESSPEDPSRSTAHFAKAGDAFQDILTATESKPDFASPDQILAVKVRLVRCLRLKKEFDAAEKMVVEILSQREKDLKAQIEAAYVYQARGVDGAADAGKYLLKAINGDEKKKIWGWSKISSRVLRLINERRTEYLPTYFEARLSSATCRREYAHTQTSTEKKLQELQWSAMELVTTVSVVKGFNEEQFAQLNSLYKQVLGEAGEKVVDLVPAQDVDATTVAEKTEPEQKAAATKKKDVKPEEPKAPAQHTSPWVLIAATLILGGGIVGYMVFSKPKRRTFKATAVTASATKPAATVKPRPSAESVKPAVKPATTAAAKSRPKPPTS